MESKELLRKQENMYWGSTHEDKVWYRKIYSGQWRLLKFGRDTPYIGNNLK